MSEKAREPIPEEQTAEPVSEEERKKERKKKLARAGVALFTSASVLVGGTFHHPDALLADEQILAPVAAYETDTGSDPGGDDGSDAGEEDETPSEEESGVRAKLRRRILRLPLAVRVFVLLPMWALGWGIWTAASGLWSMLLGPVVGKALGWLALLAALLGAFVLGIKTIFPDLPLKKILNRRSLLGLLLGGLALGAADLTVPLFWDGYEKLSLAFRAAGVALILGTLSFALIRRTLRQRRAEAAIAAEEEEEPEEPRPWTEAEVLALVDSVSRKR